MFLNISILQPLTRLIYVIVLLSLTFTHQALAKKSSCIIRPGVPYQDSTSYFYIGMLSQIGSRTFNIDHPKIAIYKRCTGPKASLGFALLLGRKWMEYFSTQLMYAAQYNHYTVVAELLRAGAEPNLQSNVGNTALILAARSGAQESVQALLSAGALPDIQTHSGYTALIWAAKKGYDLVVNQLLSAGSTVGLTNRCQETALSLATRKEYKTIIEKINLAKTKK